jgi:hypothetical protein
MRTTSLKIEISPRPAPVYRDRHRISTKPFRPDSSARVALKAGGISNNAAWARVHRTALADNQCDTSAHVSRFHRCDLADFMRNGDRTRARRVDAREPLEKLGLLHLKKSEPGAAAAGKGVTTRRPARPQRWM